MEAFNRYHKCFFKYERTLLSMIGHDYFLPEFRPGILAFAVYALTVTFIFSNLYTILYYEPFTVLNGCIFMSMSLVVSVVQQHRIVLIVRIIFFWQTIGMCSIFVFQCIVKIYSVKYSDRITWMINYLHDIYKVNATTKNRARATLFDRYAYYTEGIFKCGVALYFMSVLSYFLYPIYMYVIDGKIVQLLPTYFPGIDEDTINGFIMLSSYHVALLVFSFIGLSACDLLFTMLIANTPIMANLIEMEVEQLNDHLVEKLQDDFMIKMKLRNILLMHREMIEWVQLITNFIESKKNGSLFSIDLLQRWIRHFSKYVLLRLPALQ